MPRKATSWLVWVWLAAGAVWIGAGAVLAVEGAAGVAPLEGFKAFMANPPVIEEIVFSEKVPPSGGGRGLDGSFAQSRLFNHYQARWQTNAFLFRQLGGLEDATNRAFYFQFMARHDDHHWMVDRRPVLDLWVDDPADTSFTNNYVLSTTEFRTRLLREVLLMGVMHLQIGDLKWDGNRFEAASSITRFSATGEVFAGTNGLADHLMIQYRDTNRVYHWVARYRYETPLGLPFLPSRITCYWIGPHGQGEIEQSEYFIRNLVTREQPLERAAFDPDPYAEANGWQKRRNKNGMIYAVLPSGELQFLEPLPVPGELPVLTPEEDRWLIYPVWIAANFGISLLAWRMRKIEKEQHRTGRQK